MIDNGILRKLPDQLLNQSWCLIGIVCGGEGRRLSREVCSAPIIARSRTTSVECSAFPVPNQNRVWITSLVVERKHLPPDYEGTSWSVQLRCCRPGDICQPGDTHGFISILFRYPYPRQRKSLT